MTGPERKNPVPRNEGGSASVSDSKSLQKKQLRTAKDQESDSEAIERAVYDGMQDLRAEKPK